MGAEENLLFSSQKAFSALGDQTKGPRPFLVRAEMGSAIELKPRMNLL